MSAWRDRRSGHGDRRVLRRWAGSLLGWWAWLREVSGDDAYERYLAHHAEAHPGKPPLSRKAFFIEDQERKWGGVRRCC